VVINRKRVGLKIIFVTYYKHSIESVAPEIFYDHSKAVNFVNHGKLMTRLAYYGRDSNPSELYVC
jgi:hypothetical protein